MVQKNVIVDKMTKQYEVIGTGETTIIIIHYFESDSGSWRWLAKRLSKKFTCNLLDLTEFNDTEID